MIKIITNKQRRFLQKVLDGEITKSDNPKRFSAISIRIQEQIDKNILNLVWIVDNYPEILKDEVTEIDNANIERYRRFKAFAYILSKLNPMTEIEEVELPEILRKLGRLYPKFYFKILRREDEDDR